MKHVNELRIERHPVLEEFKKGKEVTFYYNGEKLTGCEGEPISVALKANNVMTHRYTSKKSHPRGVFCAIGRCTDCVMIVNNKPNVRTCVTPLEKDMKIETQYGVTKQKDRT